MHVIERVKSWLQGPQWDRLPDAVERLLAAYYWDGAAPVPREVRNVSPRGAYIVTSEKWYPGTIMDLSLEYSAQPEGTGSAPKPTIRVRAKVLSHGPDGVSVGFVCVNRQSQQQLVKFLQIVRSGGGQ